MQQVHFKNIPYSKQLFSEPKTQSETKFNNPKFWILGLLLLFLMAYWIYNQKINKENFEKIAQERKEKFTADSARMEECVQYALLADSSKMYPCYACEGTDSIFLKVGEVWYYGETCYENSRYSDNELIRNNLLFKIQDRGSKQKMILSQKRKIYDYIHLPENRIREEILIRPPGNTLDN